MGDPIGIGATPASPKLVVTSLRIRPAALSEGVSTLSALEPDADGISHLQFQTTHLSAPRPSTVTTWGIGQQRGRREIPATWHCSVLSAPNRGNSLWQFLGAVHYRGRPSRRALCSASTNSTFSRSGVICGLCRHLGGDGRSHRHRCDSCKPQACSDITQDSPRRPERGC